MITIKTKVGNPKKILNVGENITDSVDSTSLS